MHEFRLLIDGERINTTRTIDVINPATEELVAKAPVAERKDLDAAVDAANRAFAGWQNMPVEKRSEYLHRLADAIEVRADEFARLITLEQGKPLAQACDEVTFAQIFCRHFADQRIEPEVLLDSNDQRVEIHRRPLGVVGAIIPWNFPLLIVLYKLGPALITGNTLVMKPAPTTPLSALLFGEVARDILPAGVLNIIADDNDLGAAISAHPGIAKISFTGSTPTGKKIMASAADTLKRITLELGGNDAAIVLDDADPKTIAPGVFHTAFLNSGQVCIALKRLYVHDRIYDAVCDELTQLAKASPVGNGLDTGIVYGPVQNRAQYHKVIDYIADAREKGRIIAGGEIPDGPGFFVPITIVRDISDGARVVDEEPFGPVLPVIRYTDIDDAISRANHSPYGLGGSVWSSNLERAQQVAARLDTGTVWINQHCAFGPHIPFPPSKESGIGVEWGREGMLEYTAMKVININKSTA